MIKNILSIDFDYFLTKEVHDNVELKNPLQSYKKWLRDYESNPDFFDVGIRQQDMETILGYVLRQHPDIPVVIAESHEKIISMFKEITKDFDDPEVQYNVFNVDFHHDIYYANRIPYSENSCANWVYYLHLNQKLNQYIWLRWRESQLFKPSRPDLDLIHATTTDLAVLEDKQFDAIFICRSGSWIPPHLYPKFHEMTGAMMIHFKDIAWMSTPGLMPIHTPYANSETHLRNTVELYQKIVKQK